MNEAFKNKLCFVSKLFISHVTIHDIFFCNIAPTKLRDSSMYSAEAKIIGLFYK